MHDPPLIGEHRLERHRLSGRAHARGDPLGDLAQLLLTPAPIPLDVHRDVHSPTDAARGDRRGDLLERDEVLATAADQSSQVRTEDLDPLVPFPVVEGHFRVDAHEGEQVLEHPCARGELLGECRR